MVKAPVLRLAEANKILDAAPVATAQATPASETRMNSGVIPPRQVWAGGLAALITWVICYFLGQYTGIVIPLEIQTPISIFIGGIVASIVPPSVGDIITNLNDTIVHIAQRDPNSNVSYVLPPVQPPPGEAAIIVPPAVKSP